MFWLITIYLVGVFLSAILIAAVNNNEEEVGTWAVSALWPLVLMAVIISTLIALPLKLGVWLGLKVRECLSKRKTK